MHLDDALADDALHAALVPVAGEDGGDPGGREEELEPGHDREGRPGRAAAPVRDGDAERDERRREREAERQVDEGGVEREIGQEGLAGTDPRTLTHARGGRADGFAASPGRVG